MINPTEDDDAHSKTDLAGLTVSELLERVFLNTEGD
jgi:hypothetical protein